MYIHIFSMALVGRLYGCCAAQTIVASINKAMDTVAAPVSSPTPYTHTHTHTRHCLSLSLSLCVYSKRIYVIIYNNNNIYI